MARRTVKEVLDRAARRSERAKAAALAALHEARAEWERQRQSPSVMM